MSLGIKFFQTSNLVLANQANGICILLSNKIFYKPFVIKQPPFIVNFSLFTLIFGCRLKTKLLLKIIAFYQLQRSRN